MWSVGFIPGNEYGRAIGESALRLLRELGHDIDVTLFDLGPDRFRATGEVLPDYVLSELGQQDAVFVGAPPVTKAPDIPKGVLERGIVYGLRTGLDLFVNLRAFDGTGPAGEIDVAIARENTEGAYIREGGVLRPGTAQAIATQGSINTRFGVERCIRYSFDLARRRRGDVTLVHKVGVLEYSGELWRDAFEAVAAENPDVRTGYENVDTACIHLVQDPSRYDVIVTDNLFGDILSDLCGALAGAIERSGSADLNPVRTGPSLFEPMHGANAYAPPSVEQANPFGAYDAAAMMLDHFGSTSDARLLHAALRSAREPGDSSLRDLEAAVVRRVVASR
jgi:3-isopropylmalate dehydrogenase